MQAAGLVTRRRDERDARLVRLWLTDRWRSLRDPILAERRALAERATGALTDIERGCLESVLAKMVASLEPVAPVVESAEELP